jgi:tight adherence protein B
VRHRRRARQRLAALSAEAPAIPPTRWLTGYADRHPRLLWLAGPPLVGSVAGALGGPVAALVAVGYTGLALRSLRRGTAARRAGVVRTAALDVISGLAADLRAGVAPESALGTARRALTGPDRAVRRALGRVDAACEVSERLGAPLADLLDRVESDLRSTERARTSVAAQTSGARASAVLLALLPVAGVGLGYSMGADPAHALLRTPFGAVCVLAAMVLQLAGMAWTGRLCRSAVERAS